MPTHKPAVYADRRLQILDAALQVFSNKGFLAATNRDIAIAAGINSPGLIYHYFASKEDLLRAVIEEFAPPVHLAAHSEDLMEMLPEQGLTHIGQAYLTILENPKVGQCLRIMVAESLHSEHFAEIFREIGPFRVWRLLSTYLQRKMDEGLLRPADSAITAWCFLGPLAARMLAQVILHLPDMNEIMPADRSLEIHVSIFLTGLQAEPSSTSEGL